MAAKEEKGKHIVDKNDRKIEKQLHFRSAEEMIKRNRKI